MFVARRIDIMGRSGITTFQLGLVGWYVGGSPSFPLGYYVIISFQYLLPTFCRSRQFPTAVCGSGIKIIMRMTPLKIKT